MMISRLFPYPIWVSDGCRWISPPFHSRERALDYIRTDIEAHRYLPFDEEAERQRLMPV